MAEIISNELKGDLEQVYKKAGDLLSLLEVKDFSRESSEIRDLMHLAQERLKDICGILQIDIFTCDYLITKYKTMDLECLDDNKKGLLESNQ